MNWRAILALTVTVVTIAACNAPLSLGPGRPVRVGLLTGDSADEPLTNASIEGLKKGLTDLGYVNGQTVLIELRSADGNTDSLPQLANELVQLPVDVIVSLSTPATQAAHDATTGVPAVFVNVTDPVEMGLVTSLAHPGGNITGVGNPPDTLLQKDLEFLAQIVPGLSRVGAVLNLSTTSSQLRLQTFSPAATAMGVQLTLMDMRSHDDIDKELTLALNARVQAIINFGSPGPARDDVPRITDFARQNRIPLAVGNRLSLEAGALMSYTEWLPPTGDVHYGEGYEAAALVDRIIKGAKPADMPIQLGTSFELLINETTAHQIGVSIPPEVAHQVTEWVH
jgi:putative ABC transport system substrate-binding protein